MGSQASAAMIGRRILHAFGCGPSSARKPPDSFARIIDEVEYVGWVDGARDGRLIGWAAARSARDRLTVVAEGAGERLGVRADRYRADVQRLGHSASGYCGFSFPLAPLSGGPVRIFVSEPRFELGGSPVGKEAVAPPTPVKRTRDGRWLVAIDADPGRMSGWACDRRSPSRRPLLRLEHAGALVDSCRATLFRRDADAALGDGWHGFSLVAPRKPGVYVLRDADTGSELHRHFQKASG